MGLSPIAINTGPTIGTTTNVISMKSSTNPSRNMTSMTRTIAVNNTAPAGHSENPRSFRHHRNPRNTRLNNEAPIRIMKTIAVMRVVR